MNSTSIATKRSLITLAVLAAIAFLAFSSYYGGNTVPHGQQPLVRLNSSNVPSLKEAFNQAADSVRLLVLVSPT
jgi:hypothetical protein